MPLFAQAGDERPMLGGDPLDAEAVRQSRRSRRRRRATAGMPSAVATAPVIRVDGLRPALPVKALELPEFTMIAAPAPAGTFAASFAWQSSTQAARVEERVKAPGHRRCRGRAGPASRRCGWRSARPPRPPKTRPVDHGKSGKGRRGQAARPDFGGLCLATAVSAVSPSAFSRLLQRLGFWPSSRSFPLPSPARLSCPAGSDREQGAGSIPSVRVTVALGRQLGHVIVRPPCAEARL